MALVVVIVLAKEGPAVEREGAKVTRSVVVAGVVVVVVVSRCEGSWAGCSVQPRRARGGE